MTDGADSEPADRMRLHELGWTDPLPVPSRPGATLSWAVTTADGVDFVVASDPDRLGAWIAARTLRETAD